jgi:hypothetical protein
MNTYNNFYTDIKQSILQHFTFLEEYGFSAFKEEQLGHEYHFIAKNDFVEIDIEFELTATTAIIVSINKYFLEYAEPKNKIIEKHHQLHLNKGKIINKKVNDDFLKEMADVLKRHITFLKGDLLLLETNETLYKLKCKRKHDKEKIAKNIYTLEWKMFNINDYDVCEEFNSLDELKARIENNIEIKKYRVLDCNMKEITLNN